MLIKTEILGNLVRDAEVRNVGDRDVLSFTVAATAASWKDAKTGEQKSKTEYADCAIWGNTGSFAKMIELKLMSKGHSVRVEGIPDSSGTPTHSQKTNQYYNNIKYTVARQSLVLVNTPHAVKTNAPAQQQQAAPAQQQQHAPAQQQQAAPAQQQQYAPAQQQQAAPAQQQQYAPAQQQQAAPAQQDFVPPQIDAEDDIPF